MSNRQDFLNSYYNSFKVLFPELTEEEILEYYDESQLLGYPEKESGSMWTSELKNLYVLLRILKPKKILEIGNFRGISSNGILHAVNKNGFGEVTLVDIEDRLEYHNLLNNNFTRVVEDSHKFLAREHQYNFILQDSAHDFFHVNKELDLIKANNIVDDYIIWGHDYFVDCSKSTCKVREVYDNRRSEFSLFLPQKDSISDCGLIWVKFK